MPQSAFPMRFQACKMALEWSTTRIMGVVNVTPDSFYDGGRYLDTSRAVDRGMQLCREGADILDIGGESSRPGSLPVTAEEEIARIVPVIEGVRRQSEVMISVDTWKSQVARAALEAGAQVVNDITALSGDPQMASLLSRHQAGVVLMHMRGRPDTMQKIPPSQDILGEISRELSLALKKAQLHEIARDRIILDPGIGFGKTVADNLRILNRLSFLEDFKLPILIGTSRKSFIGKILGVPEGDRLWGTAASVTAAILRGAHMVRVHDVAEMRMVTTISEAIVREEHP